MLTNKTYGQIKIVVDYVFLTKSFNSMYVETPLDETKETGGISDNQTSVKSIYKTFQWNAA